MVRKKEKSKNPQQIYIVGYSGIVHRTSGSGLYLTKNIQVHSFHLIPIDLFEMLRSGLLNELIS